MVINRHFEKVKIWKGGGWFLEIIEVGGLAPIGWTPLRG